MTLSDFLLARINEDETVARVAIRTTAAEWVDCGSRLLGKSGEPNVFEVGFAEVTSGRYEAALAHIARHDPAHVLAECEAKRRIVEFHGPTAEPDPLCSACNVAYPCETPVLLALPYASHRHYREGWRQ